MFLFIIVYSYTSVLRDINQTEKFSTLFISYNFFFNSFKFNFQFMMILIYMHIQQKKSKKSKKAKKKQKKQKNKKNKKKKKIQYF